MSEYRDWRQDPLRLREWAWQSILSFPLFVQRLAKVLVDGHATFYPLWLRAIRFEYLHVIPESTWPAWRRVGKEASKAARELFQYRVEKLLKQLIEDLESALPYGEDLFLECYWDRKDGGESWKESYLFTARLTSTLFFRITQSLHQLKP